MPDRTNVSYGFVSVIKDYLILGKANIPNDGLILLDIENESSYINYC